MMKQYQPAHTSLASHFRCHLDGAMAIPLFCFLILVWSVLRIVYQQICPLDKLKKSRVALFSPFDIRSKDQSPTGIFDTINDSAIQGMAVCQPGNDAYFRFRYILTLIDDARPGIAIAPDDFLLAGYRVKYAMR